MILKLPLINEASDVLAIRANPRLQTLKPQAPSCLAEGTGSLEHGHIAI